MSQNAPLPEPVESALSQPPLHVGKSKHIYRLTDDQVVVKLVPSLNSFTYKRERMVPGTEVYRLDFFEMAAAYLSERGVNVAFVRRTGPDSYIAAYCSNPPFEVIVKNYAVGSTVTKCPALFPEGYRFREPVVRFDYRTEPEDITVPDGYVREYGEDPDEMRALAVRVNALLQEWLSPLVLYDFCIILGRDRRGRYSVISEISPDGMRLRSKDGQSYDKDLFREGRSDQEIRARWGELIDRLRRAA